jgi:hypothetical protein
MWDLHLHVGFPCFPSAMHLGLELDTLKLEELLRENKLKSIGKK